MPSSARSMLGRRKPDRAWVVSEEFENADPWLSLPINKPRTGSVISSEAIHPTLVEKESDLS
jgi:hypothetical protein